MRNATDRPAPGHEPGHAPAPAGEPGRLADGPLLALLDALGSAYCTISATGTVEQVGRSTPYLLGHAGNALAGRPLHETVCVLGPGGRPGPVRTCPILASVHGGRPAHRAHDVFRRADGTTVRLGWACLPRLRGTRADGAVLVLWPLTTGPGAQAVSIARVEGARQQAEDAVLELSWLSEVTTELVTMLDPDRDLPRLARLLVPRLADRAALDLFDGPGSVRRAAYAETGARADAGAGPKGTTPGGPSAFLLAAGTPLAAVLGGAGTQLLTAADSAAATLLVVPLRLREHVFGAMTLSRTGPGRSFTDTEVELAEEVARRCALALDNTRLYNQQADIAAVLQRSLLTELPLVAGLELAARYQPAQRGAEIGGDWYDAFPLPDGTLAVVIGDVVGHDLQAASRMGALRNMLRALAIDRAVDRTEEPGDTLRRLDAVACHLDTADSATAVHGHLRPAAADGPAGWTFRWANAGHPPPLLLAADGSTTLLEGGRGILLGVEPGRARPTATVALPPGSTLLLYTDGLVESRLLTLDTGIARLRAAATAGADLPLGRLCDTLIATLGDRGDDIAVIAVRVPPAP
ncbi:SpoIIE family protein phosphatase [Kitasatospora sp. NPDC057223]|uniref:SpoIIE family protein phosphatase n=1 Tax=Kitasatospora sp. NPDC057223 TaxID=3346055 RepID=UPI00362A63A0